MQTIQGPGIFLAQFIRDAAPYNNIGAISEWASSLGFKGVQIPTWDSRVLDLDAAAISRDYCDEYKGRLAESGLQIIELASYLQGQVIAVHPAYEFLFSAFHPAGLNDRQRTQWAIEALRKSVMASVNFDTANISVLSGGLAWPYIYPWPQRSPALIEDAFNELAKRWIPLLDFAHEHGITFGFELHPGSDLHDGATFVRFLEKTGNHPAACITYDPSHFHLQQMDYLSFIEIFSERIKAFHVKDAEFRSSGLLGVYGGYEDWVDRSGRFRSPGDGQIDFKGIFSRLTESGYNGWAILEWECCVKSAEQGAREGAQFISDHIIQVADYAFDNFAETQTDYSINKKILGLELTGPETLTRTK